MLIKDFLNVETRSGSGPSTTSRLVHVHDGSQHKERDKYHDFHGLKY